MLINRNLKSSSIIMGEGKILIGIVSNMVAVLEATILDSTRNFEIENFTIKL